MKSSKYERNDHIGIAHRVMNRAIQRIQDEHGVCLASVGEGMNPNVNQISLGFDVCRPMSREELRFVVVSSTEILLEEINSSEELRPHLVHYPFDSNDVTVTVFVYREDGLRPEHADIAVAGTLRGKVEYCTYSPEQRYGYYEVTEEPYEEALAIVKEGRTNDPS